MDENQKYTILKAQIKTKTKTKTSVVIYVDLMFIGSGKQGLKVKNNSEWKLQG